MTISSWVNQFEHVWKLSFWNRNRFCRRRFITSNVWVLTKSLFLTKSLHIQNLSLAIISQSAVEHILYTFPSDTCHRSGRFLEWRFLYPSLSRAFKLVWSSKTGSTLQTWDTQRCVQVVPSCTLYTVQCTVYRPVVYRYSWR